MASGPNLTELGASGIDITGGRVESEEYDPRLKGRDGLLVYREMRDAEPIVGAIAYTIDMLLRGVTWRSEKGDATDKDAEFLDECREDMSHSWSDFVSEVLSMLWYGFAPHEIVYKKRQGWQKDGSPTPSSRFNDGKIGWRKLPLRSQDTLDRWVFDKAGGLQGMVQKSPPDYQEVPIPMAKLLLFRPHVFKNNPEGRSLLRNAYRPWYFKKRIEQIEGTGIERDLAGLPTFYLPAAYLAPDAPPEYVAIRQQIETIGKNVRRDKQEYLILPTAYDEAGNKLFDFSLMASGGTRQFDTSGVIQRKSQEIAMTVLADFILLGHEKVGSFALSSDKTDLFAVSLGAILDAIEDVMNRYAIPRLWEANGWKADKLPKLVHGDIETPDLNELVNFVQGLVNAGVPLFPDEDLEAYLRDAGKLPEKSEETKKLQEEAKAEEAAGQQGGGPGGPPGAPPGGGGTGAPPDAGGDGFPFFSGESGGGA